MTVRVPGFVWLGIGLGLFYWLMESVLDAFVFDRGSLAASLVAENDPNELWMRLVTATLFVAFGWLAARSVRIERRLKEDAQRLDRLLHFVDHIKHSLPPTPDALDAPAPVIQLPQTPATSPPGPEAVPDGGAEAAIPLQDLALSDDDIGKLTRILQELSAFLDERFKELHALLELTREINMGLLLDEVLEKAYITLQSVLPYNRLGVALLEHDGRMVRARWARTDYPEMILSKGYGRLIRGSSLKDVMASGEPRIINDLPAYLKTHPLSESTTLMVAEGIRSSLTCPLIATGKPIGFMFFSSRTTNTYRNVHIDIFKLIAGHLSVMVEKSNLFQQILEGKEKSERLLLNVVPARIAARLSAGAQSVAENLPEVSILFADIEAFTRFASRFSPERVLHTLQNVFAPLDRLCELYGVEKIKTIGDEYMVMSSAPKPDDNDHLRKLAEFSLEALRSVEGMRYPDGQLVRIRIGMHTGPAVGGVIGQTKFSYDIWGDAVNVASRMESSGEAGRIHVSEEVYARLQGEFLFEERGLTEVRGKGPMKTYFLLAKKQPRPAVTEDTAGQRQAPSLLQ